MRSIPLLLVLLFASSLHASVLAPDQPRVGDQIRITYTPADGPFADSSGLIAQVLLLRSSMAPLLVETALTKTGKSWQGSFALVDTQAIFMICRFATAGSIDDHGGKYWTAYVHGSDGKPILGAHLSRATWLNGQMPLFKVQRDAAAAKEEVARELELHPHNVGAATMRWSMLMRESPGDETTALIRRELEPLYAAHAGDMNALTSMLRWFEQTGQKARADSLRSAAVAADPRGPVAKQQQLLNVLTSRDPAVAARSLEQLINEFPLSGEERSTMLSQLVRMYTSSGQIDKAAAILEKEPSTPAMLYNDLAWGLVEKGERLEDAARWASLAVERLRSPAPSTKPSYVSDREWQSGNRASLGMVLDTYGFALQKLGRQREAAKAYAEAYALTGGSDPEMNDRYIRSLSATGDLKAALRISEASVRSGKSNDSLLAAYRAAYVALKGSERGFAESLSRAKGEAARTQKDELKAGMLSTPAPEFALKTLDGTTIALKDLRGKVVLIDYWATWCGPCKMSFPFLQKAYDKYRKDSRVAIFAINTWEQEKGAARETTVKKFLVDNKYTFPVLFDDTSVEKYGVEGIPTKFVIDQKGILRFKTVGFDGGEKMLAEIDAQLAMLLETTGGK